MPGAVVHLGATVMCTHTGQGTPTATDNRVLLLGQPLVVQNCVHIITGCTLPPPPSANGPCISGTWTTAATRVKASGVPVLLSDSIGICTPTGLPLQVVMTQTRVKAI